MTSEDKTTPAYADKSPAQVLAALSDALAEIQKLRHQMQVGLAEQWNAGFLAGVSAAKERNDRGASGSSDTKFGTKARDQIPRGIIQRSRDNALNPENP